MNNDELGLEILKIYNILYHLKPADNNIKHHAKNFINNYKKRQLQVLDLAFSFGRMTKNEYEKNKQMIEKNLSVENLNES